MEKIGISACLLGIHCKYNGKHNLNLNVLDYIKGKELVLICPEAMGGLGTPRIPCEIQTDGRIVNRNHQDVTEQFILGKDMSLNKLRDNQCEQVILKDGSPSCGYKTIYDGSFTNRKIDGQGFTAKHLVKNHIKILDIK